MHRTAVVALLAATLACATASAEVYVTKDKQGNPVYTDKPESLPAERLNVATKQTDEAEVRARYEAEMKAYGEQDKAETESAQLAADSKQVSKLTAADKAKRCEQARDQYSRVMSAHRLYEPGATPDERRYLDDAEIDAARAKAKQLMDEFCGQP